MTEISQLLQNVDIAGEKARASALLLTILVGVVALGAASWMFRDAERCGKNGIAAFLVTFFAAAYGFSAIVIVVCTWIFLRPDLTRSSRSALSDLPAKFPSGIDVKLTSEDLAEDQ